MCEADESDLAGDRPIEPYLAAPADTIDDDHRGVPKRAREDSNL